MNPTTMNQQEFQNAWICLFQEQIELLQRVATALEKLAPANVAAPNLTRPLAEFSVFQWDEIGARVIQRDLNGPTIVEWGGQPYSRRSPQNKFNPAIWFSRAVGKDEDGVKYERLITFREFSEIDPLPQKIEHALAHCHGTVSNGTTSRE
jgi:hypothetical protein